MSLYTFSLCLNYSGFVSWHGLVFLCSISTVPVPYQVRYLSMYSSCTKFLCDFLLFLQRTVLLKIHPLDPFKICLKVVLLNFFLAPFCVVYECWGSGGEPAATLPFPGTVLTGSSTQTSLSLRYVGTVP